MSTPGGATPGTPSAGGSVGTPTTPGSATVTPFRTPSAYRQEQEQAEAATEGTHGCDQTGAASSLGTASGDKRADSFCGSHASQDGRICYCAFFIPSSSMSGSPSPIYGALVRRRVGVAAFRALRRTHVHQTFWPIVCRA